MIIGQKDPKILKCHAISSKTSSRPSELFYLTQSFPTPKAGSLAYRLSIRARRAGQLSLS